MEDKDMVELLRKRREEMPPVPPSLHMVAADLGLPYFDARRAVMVEGVADEWGIGRKRAKKKG